jgi:hypothetical protein
MSRGGDGKKETDEGDVMELRSPSNRKFLARPVIDCAQCGAQIFVPDWCEYFDDGKVRHLWACEACGYRFETIARFPATGSAPRLRKTVAAA